MNQLKSLNLVWKAKQIQCSLHRQPIISLDIEHQNVKESERLLCLNCTSKGQSIEFIEQQLNNLFLQEQETINLEKQVFDELFDQLQNLFQMLIESINNQQQIQREKFDLLIQQQFPLTQIIHKLSRENICRQTLQDIAVFLSKQRIEQNLQQNKDKFESSLNIIGLSLENLSDQLNYFRDILNQNLKQTKPELISLVQFDINNLNQKNSIELDGHNFTLTAVAISSDYKYLASGEDDWKIVLWNLENQSINYEFDGVGTIYELVFSYDDKWLAAAQYTHPYHILIFNIDNPQKDQKIILRGHVYSVNSMVFTKNSKFLLSGSEDMTLRIWNIEKSYTIGLQLLSDNACISISNNQKFISAACLDGQAYLFESSNIEDIKKLVNWKADRYVNCTIFTPDSKNVLTSYQEIKFWSIEQLLSKNQQKTPLRVIKTNDDIRSMCLRMNGSILTNSDGQIKIWNLANRRLIKKSKLPEGYNYLNIVNKYIIIWGKNRKLNLYELASI